VFKQEKAFCGEMIDFMKGNSTKNLCVELTNAEGFCDCSEGFCDCSEGFGDLGAH